MGGLDGAARAWESSEGEMEEEMVRRGSLPTIVTTNRRGSKLQDILRYNQEKRRKKDGKYRRDAQGFVWKRMPVQYYDDVQPQAQQQPSHAAAAYSRSAAASNASSIPPSPLISAPPSHEQLAAMAGAGMGVLDPAAAAGMALSQHPSTAQLTLPPPPPPLGSPLDEQHYHLAPQMDQPQQQLAVISADMAGDVLLMAGHNPQDLSGKKSVMGGAPPLAGSDTAALPHNTPQVKQRKVSQNRSKPTGSSELTTIALVESNRGQPLPGGGMNSDGSAMNQYEQPNKRLGNKMSRSNDNHRRQQPMAGDQVSGGNGSHHPSHHHHNHNHRHHRHNPADPDSISLRSETSFKTCSSEPELGPLVPRAVSDTYKYTSGRSTLERQSGGGGGSGLGQSFKEVQQKRYSNALDAVVGTSGNTNSGLANNNTGGGSRKASSTASRISPVPPTPTSTTSRAARR